MASYPTFSQGPAESGYSQHLYASGGSGTFDHVGADDGDQTTEKSFTDTLLPKVKNFSHTWIKLQHEKREQKRNEKFDREKYSQSAAASTGLPFERYRDTNQSNTVEERKLRMHIEEDSMSSRKIWATRLLGKIRKDIQPRDREHFVRSVLGTLGGTRPECVMTVGDVRNKMRRIDCFRQSNKVWRLDLVTLVLFQGLPLESTDGERIGKVCNRDTCIQPLHLYLIAKDIDMVLAFALHSKGMPANIDHKDSNLRVEPRSAYDMEELYREYHVPMSQVEGFNQPTHNYADPVGASSNMALMAGSRSASSAPIAMRPMKRPSSFDDRDDISDPDQGGSVPHSLDSSSIVGSMGSEYHSMSSPKIKAESTTSPFGSFSMGQTSSLAHSAGFGTPPQRDNMSICSTEPMSRSLDNSVFMANQQQQLRMGHFAHKQVQQHVQQQQIAMQRAMQSNRDFQSANSATLASSDTLNQFVTGHIPDLTALGQQATPSWLSGSPMPGFHAGMPPLMDHGTPTSTIPALVSTQQAHARSTSRSGADGTYLSMKDHSDANASNSPFVPASPSLPIDAMFPSAGMMASHPSPFGATLSTSTDAEDVSASTTPGILLARDFAAWSTT